MTEHVAGSRVPREARSYQGQRAGMVTRLAASVCDVLVVALAVTVVYLGINAVAFLLHPRQFQFVATSQLPLLALAAAVSVLYLAGSWSVVGGTYGCHLMGIRVVDRRGRRPRPLVSLVRAVLYVVFPVGLLWCAVGSSRRSVQDLILGTYAIYDWMPRPVEP